MATGHGGNLRELARRAGRDADADPRFQRQRQSAGPARGLRAVAGRGASSGWSIIPIPTARELVECLAARHQAAAEQIVVGNGSSEIFLPWPRAAFARAVIPVPSYIDYAAAVRAAGREVCCLQLDEARGLRPRLARLEAQLRGEELVMLGQPNNPTGLAFDRRGIPRAGRAGIPRRTFVVDEAFADFIDGYCVAGRADCSGGPT